MSDTERKVTEPSQNIRIYILEELEKIKNEAFTLCVKHLDASTDYKKLGIKIDQVKQNILRSKE